MTRRCSSTWWRRFRRNCLSASPVSVSTRRRIESGSVCTPSAAGAAALDLVRVAVPRDDRDGDPNGPDVAPVEAEVADCDETVVHVGELAPLADLALDVDPLLARRRDL